MCKYPTPFLFITSALIYPNIIFVLDVTEQPEPIAINCRVNAMYRDPFCDTGISPTFCAWKTNGIYRHPSFCNRFVQCVAGSVYVTRCQSPRTAFNQFIGNCDFSGFFRCNNIGEYFFSRKFVSLWIWCLCSFSKNLGEKKKCLKSYTEQTTLYTCWLTKAVSRFNKES